MIVEWTTSSFMTFSTQYFVEGCHKKLIFFFYCAFILSFFFNLLWRQTPNRSETMFPPRLFHCKLVWPQLFPPLWGCPRGGWVGHRAIWSESNRRSPRCTQDHQSYGRRNHQGLQSPSIKASLTTSQNGSEAISFQLGKHLMQQQRRIPIPILTL